LGGVVGGEAEDGSVADDGSGISGGKVVLTEMEAGVEGMGVVGAVVHDEGCIGLTAESGEFLSEGEGFGGPEVFVAELENLGSGFEDGFGGFERRKVIAREGAGVEDRVEAGECQHGFSKFDCSQKQSQFFMGARLPYR
jgi:hypothetical protein